MAGTSGYSYDVSKSMDIKDPYKADEAMDETANLVKNVQRYTTGGPAVTLNRFQKQAARSSYLGDEQQRRVDAAQGAIQTATTQDQRLSGAGNTLSDALNKYRNTQDDLAQKQAQSLATTGLETEIGLRSIEDKRKEIDFELEKNQTTRDDAISNAWVEGIVNNKMQDLQLSGAMKLQDIDQYFKLWQNEIDQSFQDWRNKTQTDWESEMAKMTANAAAMANIFAGSLTLAEAGVNYLLKGMK